MGRLVIVSNRVGPLNDAGQAGGLAVAVADALKSNGGLWFGWTGETSQEGTFGPIHREEENGVSLATIDMTPLEAEEFYAGFANSTLWPILHYRLDLAHFDRRFELAYQRVNERFGSRLRQLIRPDDTIWVQDYHFLLLGEQLRSGGFTGPLGFFLHTPFPGPEILSALPNAKNIVRAMMAFDVLGFQTEIDRRNFRRFVLTELNGHRLPNKLIVVGERTAFAAAFPIGIDADGFSSFVESKEAQRFEGRLRRMLGEGEQIIGVDRLDYSKGIPDRFRAFECLLEHYPENRGKVSLMQIAPLSRSELDAYSDLRSEAEELAGHINGIYAGLDWTPVRIMTRGFTRRALSGIYRASRIALVTPLRDGMNLVAKEYVAAQDPDDPGVLVLSKFTGAATQLTEALLVNPHDIVGVAEALQTALHMRLEERKERWDSLNTNIRTMTADSWCSDFLRALDEHWSSQNSPASEPGD